MPSTGFVAANRSTFEISFMPRDESLTLLSTAPASVIERESVE